MIEVADDLYLFKTIFFQKFLPNMDPCGISALNILGSVFIFPAVFTDLGYIVAPQH